jgi:hypothetical protein
MNMKIPEGFEHEYLWTRLCLSVPLIAVLILAVPTTGSAASEPPVITVYL